MDNILTQLLSLKFVTISYVFEIYFIILYDIIDLVTSSRVG